jgi:hypothetical protein
MALHISLDIDIKSGELIYDGSMADEYDPES